LSNKAKKKVIFDVTVLVSGNVSGNIHKTGLYRVAYEVLKNLEKLELYDILLFDVYYREREIRKYVQKDFPTCSRLRICSLWYRIFFFPLGDIIDQLRKSEQASQKRTFQFFLWGFKNTLILLDRVARKIDRRIFRNRIQRREIKKCDIYYSTYFPIPVLIRLNERLKKVYTIHDMIPVMHPEYFSSPYNQLLLKEVVDNISLNDFVICVSESTKKDVLRYRSDLNPNQIVVDLLGSSEYFYPVRDRGKIDEIRARYNIPLNKRYLLSVCTIEPRKNLKTVLTSFKEILNEDRCTDLILVLTGSPGWGSDILMDEINKINERYNCSIILTGFVNDEDLSVLYSGAYAFIYLSLYEGFGLPPLEAMQCGVPVISSNTSSLPEVIGDAGILVDPAGIAEIKDAINLLYNDLNFRNSLAHKSLNRSSEFQWTKTTNIIKNVFQNVLEYNG
jgi:glycosyltransferase involved in cell wall biosynthesis